MTTPGAAVLGVDNVLFTVGELAAAVDFYADTLGFELVFQLAAPGLALFRLGPETPGLLVRVGGEPGGGRVWLAVRDARAATAGLAGAGTPFATATGWTVELADPWGNVVGFADYTIRPEHGRA